jgi:hypothetical protein
MRRRRFALALAWGVLILAACNRPAPAGGVASGPGAPAPQSGGSPADPTKPHPALACRHPLQWATSPADLPADVTRQLSTWMALHGERWNKTDAISQGDLTAQYLWAAQSGGDWIVGFESGGVACCSTRFNLFAAKAGGGYDWVTPPIGAPDYYGDPTCKGIDGAIDAYGGAAAAP